MPLFATIQNIFWHNCWLRRHPETQTADNTPHHDAKGTHETQDQETILRETPQPKRALDMEAIGSRTHEQGNRKEARGIGGDRTDSSISAFEQARSTQRYNVGGFVVQEEDGQNS